MSQKILSCLQFCLFHLHELLCTPESGLLGIMEFEKPYQWLHPAWGARGVGGSPRAIPSYRRNPPRPDSAWPLVSSCPRSLLSLPPPLDTPLDSGHSVLSAPVPCPLSGSSSLWLCVGQWLWLQVTGVILTFTRPGPEAESTGTQLMDSRKFPNVSLQRDGETLWGGVGNERAAVLLERGLRGT